MMSLPDLYTLYKFFVQNYIGEKISPDEKIPWGQLHIKKGFVGKLSPDFPSK